MDVAVIDTGIKKNHEDLKVSDKGVNAISRDRNTPCANLTNTNWDDDQGHGTHVAGTIGALDNGKGVVGVAPGANLHPVKVLDSSGSGSWSDVICGIEWSVGNNMEVANMSLGATGRDTGCSDGGLHQAICNAVSRGLTIAVAAGNSKIDLANNVPASYDEVITATALSDFDGKPGKLWSGTQCRRDGDDTNADFSNYTNPGSLDERHTIAAPGVCVYSTTMDGKYGLKSGTSMASPHVAGAAALYIAGHPGAQPTAVRDALLNNASAHWNNTYWFDGYNSKRSYGKLLWLGGSPF